MPTSARIARGDREFFGHVSRAAFANPFGREREELDRRLGGPRRGPAGDNLRGAIARVAERVDRLEAEGAGSVRDYAGEDREVMLRVLLFDGFHRSMDEFDDLIRRQAEAGDAPVPVPFAAEALGRLARRGFSGEESRRYFAFFYQLRRAYFFIAEGLVGASDSMRRLRTRLWEDVFTRDTALYGACLWNRMEDFSLLILGETGTGKGSAAAAVGRSGFIPFEAARGCFAESFTRNFVDLNLSQFPETLIESELFGHRRGAFTGAIENHEGAFARCTPHGAIFLDEIGDVAVPVQIKLLQVLQERTFSPVGSHEKRRFRGRVIAATNRPLDAYRRSGRFRDDLYYRLCSDIVVAPPLRQRLAEEPAELERLVTHLVARTVGAGARGLVESVCEALRRDLPADYGWPGNVRELEQAVRRVILTGSCSGNAAGGGADLPARLAAAVSGEPLDARGLLQAYCALIYDRWGTYEEVARRTGLDRRTAKKYALAGRAAG